MNKKVGIVVSCYDSFSAEALVLSNNVKQLYYYYYYYYLYLELNKNVGKVASHYDAASAEALVLILNVNQNWQQYSRLLPISGQILVLERENYFSKEKSHYALLFFSLDRARCNYKYLIC